MTLEKIAEAIKLYEGWLDAEQHPPYGSRSFRNNNPGNIEFTSWDDPWVHGIDGRGFPLGRGFNIYYNYQDGWNSLMNLLYRRKSEHPGWTILQLMTDYAPPSENDTGAYAAFIERAIGASPQTKLEELT